MRDQFNEALRAYRRDLIAAAITAALLTPLVQYAGNLTWREAAAAAIAPLLGMLGIKLLIDGWLAPAELDTDDAELVDIHVDRRGRLPRRLAPPPPAVNVSHPRPGIRQCEMAGLPPEPPVASSAPT